MSREKIHPPSLLSKDFSYLFVGGISPLVKASATDPSIVKPLEEDEDESMHSGTDVDACQAALNRDIQGSASTSQPSMGSTALKNAIEGANASLYIQHSLESTQRKQQGSALDKHQHNDLQAKESHLQHSQNQDYRQQGSLHNQDSESQYMKLQKMSSQQASGAEQPADALNCGLKQVPFGLLLPTLTSQLDKDRSVQLHTLFAKLRRNEISKEGFTRHMKGIVGDKMLRMAISKLPQMKANQAKTGIQAPGHSNHPRMSSAVSESSVQNSHSDPCGIPVNQVPSSNSGTLSTSACMQGLNKHPQEHMQLSPNSFLMYGTVSGSFRSLSGSNINTSGSSLKQQLHGSQMRQMTNNQSVGSTPFEGSTQSATNMMAIPKFERPTSTHHPSIFQSGSISHFQSSSSLPLNSASWQGSATKVQTTGPLSPIAHVKKESVDQTLEQPQKPLLSVQKDLSSAPNEQSNATPGVLKDNLEKRPFIMGLTTTNTMQTSSIAASLSSQLDSGATLNSCVTFGTSPAGVNVRAPPNKPSVGQKKPLDALGSSPQPSSKKQKVSGASLDQSIEQLNDVTAVSGINLREQEEQLFSGPEEASFTPEASKRVAQEEEERLILQKSPTQKKLAEIMTKSGLKRISNDFERCLSLCVEERMRGLMSTIIRFSRQRVDAEKPRHRTFITSVIWQQINEMNQKVKEEWLMRQAEPEKLKKLNEPEGDGGVDTEEREDNRAKLTKANKDDDAQMRTTAANVAALAAVGGDDMLSKWQLMAEQARQKLEGGMDATSGSQSGKDRNQKPTSAAGRNIKDSQKGSRCGSAAGSGRKFGKSQGSTQEPEVIRPISVKDVISVLEREPQMCKSTLIYRLYDRICS